MTTGRPLAIVEVRCPHPGCGTIIATIYSQNGRIWWSGCRRYIGTLDQRSKKELRDRDAGGAPRERVEGARIGSARSYPFGDEELVTYCRHHGRLRIDGGEAADAVVTARKDNIRITLIATAFG